MKKQLLLLLIIQIIAVNIYSQSLTFEVIPGSTPEMRIANIDDVQYPSVNCGDVNNDGFPEIMVTGRNEDMLASTNLYLNDGAGNIAKIENNPFPVITEGATKFADVDGDGDLDVLILGRHLTSILYLNDGNGIFTEDTLNTFPKVKAPNIEFGDIDGDNDLDLMITGLDEVSIEKVTILYTNDGNGVFTEDLTVPFDTIGVGSVCFNDIDLDNDIDIIITGPNTQLYLNDGVGNFATGVTLTSQSYYSSSLDIADINGDNDKDILITGGYGNDEFTDLYINDGALNFTKKTGTSFYGIESGDSEMADVDNDGDIDFVVAGNARTKLYINDGGGNFTEKINNSFPHPSYNPRISFVDVDNDNDQDLVITGSCGELFLNDGNGNFIKQTNSPFVDVDDSKVAYSDIDNDNDMDIIITGFSDNIGQAKLYKNNGNGYYTNVINTQLYGVVNGGVDFADIDNDGDEDLFVTGFSQGTGYNQASSFLYINDGQGNYTRLPNNTFERLFNGCVVFEDIDGDNDKDILLAGETDVHAHIVNLYINDGLGNFTLKPDTVFQGIENCDFKFSDVDNDGDKDVLIIGDVPTKLYINNGNGDFTIDAINSAVFQSVVSGEVNFADVDDDGDEDVFIIGELFSGLYSNDGNGNFSLTYTLPFIPLRYSTIDFNDIDLDGDQDIIISGADSNYTPTTKLYLNNGVGSFTEYTDIPFVGIIHGDIELADIDGDSDYDVVVTGLYFSQDYISLLYRNTSCLVKHKTINVYECAENPYTVPSGDETYTISGTYNDTIQCVCGADSILTINLSFSNNNDSTIFLTECNSFTVPSGDETYTGTGVYYDTITNSLGCDSIITYALTIVDSSSSYLYINACDSFVNPSQNMIYYNSGIYHDTITNILGCDSFITFDLIISHPSFDTINVSSCNLFTVFSGNQTYYSSGIYNDTIINTDGCDSIITINLTINQASINSVFITECNSFTVPSGDETYTETGVYYDTITNSLGCDSIITYALTIVDSSSSYLYINACDSFVSPSQNMIYYNSGTYHDTITNILGCDSFITLDITITYSSFDTTNVTTCDSYTTFSGNQTYYSSGIYNDTMINTDGCDSIITINLTINQASTNSVFITECNSFTVPSGYETYTETGVYNDTITNSLGCDSVITFYLTISHTSFDTINVSSCNSYTVSSGNQTYYSSGIYNDTITNTDGCDSIITINLTINQASTNNVFITDCNSFTVPSGDETYTETGVYNDTITNSLGCDSIITINLTISSIDTSVTQFQSNLTSNAINCNYQWLDCNNNYSIITGETDSIFIGQNNGSYAVEITENNCIDTSMCYNIEAVNISNNNINNILIYPNPTTGKINITGVNMKTIELLNSMGKILDNFTVNNNEYILNLRKYSKGIYFIKIQTNTQILIHKIIFE